MMWRWIILALVAANGLFWLWSHGQLRDLGWGPAEVAEPARLKNQLHPEALVVKPQEPPAANTSANTSANASAHFPAVAAEAAPVAPATPAPSITPPASSSATSSATSSAAPATTSGK